MIEPHDEFEPELDGFSYEAALPVNHGRTPLDVVLSDFTERQRRGENISVEDFAVKYPELADEIRELFPMVAAMERLKERKEAAILKQRLAHDVQLERIGGCRMVRELGRGGMGIVFEAVHEKRGNRVAVKLLPWKHLDASRFREQFEREAKLTASLRHRNIVPVVDYGESDGFSFYVMQFIEGVGLDWIIEQLRGHEGIVYADEIERLHSSRNADATQPTRVVSDSGTSVVIEADVSTASNGSSPTQSRSLRREAWQQIARIGLQVADALHYAHGAGTAHHDIKPANLLLDKDGKVWVTDFGLAQALDRTPEDSATNVAGTLRYMAPEQFSEQFDRRSDIYSLGITLYELITLQPAFAERDDRELVKLIMEAGPMSPRGHNPAIPIDLETIVQKAIARDPDARFQTAGELAGELRRFINGQPLHIKRPGLLRRTLSWYRRAVGRDE
ncbi:MAG: serine/threonine protein kinase [Planctomycetaceae bacterium]|jgi:eukaryotic-like serine/threonine-protein kinase|nr:serine/threonine protein kinase [Planctomycetaceae bacterium]MBT6485458.1 serine/threonine protein kinase [Planctomycetaceae bacterium]MBT6497254.1 serine/threonine protein kinase [Planctomycetaceae bacterium]